VARLVRPVGRFALTLAVIAVLLLISRPVHAQSAAAYGLLVDRYLTAPEAAVTQLARWSRDDAGRAANEWTRGMPAGRLRAAIMLHTDLAYVLMIDGQTGLGLFHVAIAQHMIDGTVVREPGGAARAFAQRWFEYAASLLTAHGLLNDADRMVRDGLAVFPRGAMLYVARGVIAEYRVALSAPGARSRWFSGDRLPTRSARLLDAAAADYRRAIELDATLAIAWVRLGSVHMAVGDDRAADDLHAALTHATDDRDRYLAHLLLGAVAQRANRLEEARRAYQTALALGGAYQTPYVALSYVEEARGDHDRARDIAVEYARRADKVDDPWWDFHLGGFDSAALVWLRTEARR
jgi:tetratricopeptide (TPR) repeat protein